MNITPLPGILVSALALSVAVTTPAVTQEVEEAPSTVNATYVAESATDALEPGEKIENLFVKNVTQDYILQKLTDRVWFFQVQFSGTMFYVGDEGVLLIDISSTPISRRSGALGGPKVISATATWSRRSVRWNGTTSRAAMATWVFMMT